MMWQRKKEESKFGCVWGGLGACSMDVWTTLSLFIRGSSLLSHFKLALLQSSKRLPSFFPIGKKKESESKSMKMSSAGMENSKKKISCGRLGGYLREQKGRLYIIRRCVVMLLCWHD